MSNIPPPRNPFDMSTPIEAEIIDQSNPFARQHLDQPRGQPPRKRSWLLPILFGGLGFLVLGLLVVPIIMVVMNRENVDPNSPALAWEPSENRESIRAALDGTWQVAEDDPRYFVIRRQLSRLEQAHATDDRERLEALVDWPRYLSRYYGAYRFQPIEQLSKMRLKRIAQDEFEMPQEANDFRIASVSELSESDWLVYTYAQQGDLDHIGYLFHFHRHEDDWKLVDWCEIPELRWQSEFYGLGAGPTFGDHEGDQQRAFIEQLLKADEQQTEYDYPAARDTLRRAEKLWGISQIHDSNLHLLAVRWQIMGDYDEALRLYGEAADPDRTPWLHFLASMCYYSQQEYEQALRTIALCEQNAGFLFDLELVKAYSLEELGRSDEAAVSALALLRHQPEHSEAIALAMKHVPVENYDEVFQAMGSGDEVIQSVFDQAYRRLYDDDLEGYLAMRAFIAQNAPDYPRLPELDADLLHYQGDLAGALAMYQDYAGKLSAADDQETLQMALASLIPLGLKFHTAPELYQQVDFKRSMLEALVDGIEYDEGWIGAKQLAEILPLHQEAVPDDPRISFYQALVAEEQGNLAEAAAAYREAIAHFEQQDDEEAEYLLESLRNSLLNVRYESGEWLAVYQDAADRDAAFRSLGQLMEYDSNWPDMQRLVDLHPATEDGIKLLARYYQLRIQEEAALESADAGQISLALAGYQQLERDNEEVGELSDYQFTPHVNNLLAESEDFMAYFWRQEEAPEGAFRSLSTRFREEQRLADLDQLLAFFRKEFPESEALLDFDLETLWRAEDYAGYIAKIGTWPAERIVDQGYEGHQKRERLVLSHLMLQQRIDAWVVALQPEADVDLQVMVKMATGDTPSVEELLTSDSDEYSYFPIPPAAQWLAVADIDGYLRGSDFRQIRAELPLPASGRTIGTHAMLLYPQVHADDTAAIELLLGAANLEGIRVEPLELDSTTFRLVSGEGEACLLTIGSEPLIPDAELGEHAWEGEQPFVEAARSHAAWLALELPQGSSEAMESLWERLLPALVRDATVVWASPVNSTTITLIEPEQIARLRLGEPLSSFRRQSVSAYMPFGNQDTDDDGTEGARQWRDKLGQAVASPAAGRVRIRLMQGSALEKVWLSAEEVQHEGWGNYVIHGRMEQDSRLNPYLLAGDLVRIQPAAVLEWED